MDPKSQDPSYKDTHKTDAQLMEIARYRNSELSLHWCLTLRETQKACSSGRKKERFQMEKP